MPFNPTTKRFYQDPTTILDVNPDGDTVKQGFTDREKPAWASLYQDLNILMANGAAGQPDGQTLQSENGIWSVIADAMIPKGLIALWNGTIVNIPTGWALCDGQNNTPDLRNVFVIGAHSDHDGKAQSTITGNATQKGGSKDAVVVSHGHGASSSNPGNFITGGFHVNRGSKVSSWGVFSLADGPTYNVYQYGNDGSQKWYQTVNIAAGSHAHAITVNSAGESGANKNLPPYYALAYIMKV